MKRFYNFAFSLLVVFFFTSSVLAQQSEQPQDELLKIPVTVAREVGVYKDINLLPESVRRTKAFARGLHELQHYAGFDGVYDREERIAAFEQTKSDILRDAMVSDKVSGSKLPIFSSAWTNIGPVNTGGMTKSLAIDPTNSNIMYAGAVAGGVWKTTNASTTCSWMALTDLVIPDLSVASIAIDPNSHNIIYVGSGDPSVATDGFPGTGLYKSADAGSTWNKIGAAKLPGTINKVLVDPNNSSIVLAASFDNNRGLYRSTDSGVTFTKVFPATKNADGIIWDIEAGQVIAGKQIVYCVEGNNPGDTSTECGMYKSIDDGATWVKIAGVGLPTGDLIGKAALAIPSDDQTKVYCFMANPKGDLQGLYKSINSGVLFTSVGNIPTSIFNPQGNGPQGWYDLYFAIAPTTNVNDTLYIGGIEAYYSYNSGGAWTAYSSYQITDGPHVDHQSIAIDPNNSRNVFIGTDGGVYRSNDAGVNWGYHSTGMETMRFYHIGLDAKDNLKTYGGAQDQGIWKLSSGQSSSFIFGGDGFQPIVDPTNSNILYVEGPLGDLYKSTDGGSNYNSINNSAFTQGSGNYETTDWETPFAMAPKDHLTLLTGRQRLWISQNGGTSWSTASKYFMYGSTNYLVESIGLSPSNVSYYYLGLQGGKIQVTVNGGTTWADRSTGLPNGSVRSIVCSPTNASWALAGFEVWSTGSARVMLTTNAGVSWTNVSGTSGNVLPGVPVNCLAIDSTDPKNIWYAATDNGIYYTRNAGSSWSVAGSGIGLAPCVDVQIHANKTTIRVGTHGRSIYEGNVNVLPVELTGLTAKKTATGTNLIWNTSSEHDDSGFWVQRSFNYQPFENLSFVTGAGNSNTTRSYNYFDPMHDDGYYIYRLSQIDLDGSSHLSNIVDVTYGASASELRLDQSFPNPFLAGYATTGSARIHYVLPEDDIVTLRISSVSGAIVRTLLNHQSQSGGDQNAFWDGTDNNGATVASGVYYYRLETASGGNLWNKMVLVSK
jgi:hypothetical protein